MSKQKLSSAQVWALIELKTKNKIANIGIIHVRTRDYLVKNGLAVIGKDEYIRLTKFGNKFKY